jgi:hypothetical protein
MGRPFLDFLVQKDWGSQLAQLDHWSVLLLDLSPLLILKWLLILISSLAQFPSQKGYRNFLFSSLLVFNLWGFRVSVLAWDFGKVLEFLWPTMPGPVCKGIKCVSYIIRGDATDIGHTVPSALWICITVALAMCLAIKWGKNSTYSIGLFSSLND